jgi:hypothetical protein
MSADPLLVVLTDTGKIRDGYPVLRHHPDEAAIASVLSRGFSGKILRLYRLEQTYLERAARIRPEPAYLLFSNHQGGVLPSLRHGALGCHASGKRLSEALPRALHPPPAGSGGGDRQL